MLGRLGSMQHVKGDDEDHEDHEDHEDAKGGSKGCWSHDDDADSMKKSFHLKVTPGMLCCLGSMHLDLRKGEESSLKMNFNLIMKPKVVMVLI